MKKTKAAITAEGAAARFGNSQGEQTVTTPGSENAKTERLHAPTHEEIATVAYLKYLNSGAQDGDDLRHWFEAERRLLDQEHPNDG